MVRRSAFVIVLIFAMALPCAPALAASASSSGYDAPAGVTQLDVSQPNGTTSAGVPSTSRTVKQSSSSSLPFTGLDVGLIGVAGLTLLLLGFGMARISRSPRRVE